MRFFRGITAAVLTGLALLAPAAALGQERPAPEKFLSAGGVGEDLDLSKLSSPFNLFAQGDEAVAATRSNGQSANCITNLGIATYFNYGCASPQYTRTTGGGLNDMYFDLMAGFTVAPSDMPSVIDPVGSGLKGGGFQYSQFSYLVAFAGGSAKVWASDRSGSELLSFGVKTTNDASCTNFTSGNSAFLRTGFQMLPVADCPPTHPPGGFAGAHPIEAEAYLELFESGDPTFQDDPFAFWRVPEELQRTDKTFGDFQTYGEWNDYYFQALPKYGAVIPGGTGAPEFHGWPAGIDVYFDAFYFGLPTVGGTMFWQATMTNNSERVYGQPFDYDSVYFTLNYDPLIGPQSAAHYIDLSRGAILFNNTGDGCVNNPNPPGAGCRPGNTGFEGGAAGIVFLKSPLGDQRFKQFTDPESPFFAPDHPRRGDTITVNHQRMCGFGGCYAEFLTNSVRSIWGLASSQGRHALDGRAVGDVSASTYHRTFRPHDWPNRSGEFNRYVPGVDDSQPIWDYNKDGVADTIYSDACGPRGCVELWSDTLPSGFTNNYGNIAMTSLGPFKLAAGDTVGLVLAFVGAADSAGMDATINNSIDFYNNFFLGPEAAPPPNIVAVDVVTGNEDNAQIRLLLDDAAEDFVDPFLSRLDVAADLGLNPWLEDSIGALIENNVEAIHIFKSCNGGSTYTDDGDCKGDPANDPTSKWAGFGWLPWRSFEADDDGQLPNTVVDNGVISGVTYTYVVVTETRGAVFDLVRGGEGALASEEVTFAPKLFSSLSPAATNPNVAGVYVPLGLAAGAERAQIETISRSGISNIPVSISAVGTAATGGTFRAIFVDSVVVERVETLDGGQVTSTQTTVRGLLTREASTGETVVIQEFSFTREGDVTRSGLELEDQETTGGQRITTFAGGQAMLVVTEAGVPLLTTTTLSGDDATPGSFIGSDDFPFFTVSVDADAGGTFQNELFLTQGGDTIAGRASPSVQLLTSANRSEALEGSQFGTLAFEYVDPPFGNRAPFRIDLPEPTVIENFTAAISNREVGMTSSTDPAALEAVQAAGEASNLDAADLVAYNLPFTVRNVTYDRPVQVLVAQHQESILLGDGLDTLRVDVPGNNWVPGDVMYIVEQVTREVTDDDGLTVIGPDGQPQTEQALVATFKITLGCIAPRESCDPTVGGRNLSGYVPVRDNTTHLVNFLVPFRGGEEVVFRLRPAVAPADVAEVTSDDLSRVHVVPNPYLFTSYYEQQGGVPVLKFTSLPPEGRIRIFDVAGSFIQEINYTADDLEGGDLNWDLTTREGLELAYGLYVFVLETPEGASTMGKFVIIR